MAPEPARPRGHRQFMVAGPDGAQRPRRAAHRLRPRRPELPDRAPPLLLSMPRPNPRRAQPLVAAFCAERDVPYTQTSLLASYAQALGHLAAVGSELVGPATGKAMVSVPARR